MMIEMKVLKVEPRGPSHLIALADHDQRIVLPFFVDPADARAISAALSGELSDRPATHDLLHSIVTGFNIAVRRVRPALARSMREDESILYPFSVLRDITGGDHERCSDRT